MTSTQLRRGAYGETVAKMQAILIAQGFLRSLTPSELGHFGPITHSAVLHFQQTHLGPSRAPLNVTGVVDLDTAWALRNPSGEEQRSHIVTAMPAGLTPKRIAVLDKGLAFHARGVKEVPNGSNRGPEVDSILPSYLVKKPPPGPAWCCYSVMALIKEALGSFPLGGHIGSCYRTWVKAKARGMVTDDPTPGDCFLMLWRDDNGNFTQRGHIGLVLRADDDKINTLEGNVGNRYALSRRDRSAIHCFVNFYGQDEQPTAWERGTVAPALAVANLSTR